MFIKGLKKAYKTVALRNLDLLWMLKSNMYYFKSEERAVQLLVRTR